MSRIGRLPVVVPAGVDIAIDGQAVTVKGPKGQLALVVAEPIAVAKGESGAVEVTRPDDERLSRSLHGLTRTLIANMVQGVTAGTRRRWKSSAPVTACRPRVPTSSSPSATATRSRSSRRPASLRRRGPDPFSVQGIDKQQVGEVAANIRKLRKPDPYKGKGIRYAGEQIRRKVGKAGKK
jgi:large subunit ribosomal protein L6